MAVSTRTSLIISSVLSVLIFSTIEMYRAWFRASEMNTILCGYLGSWFFIFLLTALANLETIALGSGFQVKLFPEVIICLLPTILLCGSVHRVCITTSILFSIVGLFFINKISQKYYNTPVPVDIYSKKKRK